MVNTQSFGNGQEENKMKTNKTPTLKAFERFAKKYMVAYDTILFESDLEGKLYAHADIDGKVTIEVKA